MPKTHRPSAWSEHFLFKIAIISRKREIKLWTISFSIYVEALRIIMEASIYLFPLHYQRYFVCHAMQERSGWSFSRLSSYSMSMHKTNKIFRKLHTGCSNSFEELVGSRREVEKLFKFRIVLHLQNNFIVNCHLV